MRASRISSASRRTGPMPLMSNWTSVVVIAIGPLDRKVDEGHTAVRDRPIEIPGYAECERVHLEQAGQALRSVEWRIAQLQTGGERRTDVEPLVCDHKTRAVDEDQAAPRTRADQDRNPEERSPGHGDIR